MDVKQPCQTSRGPWRAMGALDPVCTSILNRRQTAPGKYDRIKSFPTRSGEGIFIWCRSALPPPKNFEDICFWTALWRKSIMGFERIGLERNADLFPKKKIFFRRRFPKAMFQYLIVQFLNKISDNSSGSKVVDSHSLEQSCCRQGFEFW